MAGGRGIAGLGSLNSRISGSPETVDRTLITACAVIWLLVLGMGVAATVTLVDLGKGRPVGETGSSTPWLLYVIIAVSAVVIAMAIPLLLRARRDALNEPAVVDTTSRGAVAVTDRDPPGYPGPMPARLSTAALSAETLDRMWLRCGLGVVTMLGAAYFAVALAAYLIAVDSTGGAWAALAVAAFFTVAMVPIPLYHLRQLKASIAEA